MDFDVKQKVRDYYGNIAQQVNTKGSGSCCGTSSCCGDISNASLIYDGNQIKDLPKEAVAASLGCADPVLFADLKEGEIVLDLGSGGGIDVLVASRYVGSSGKVYGLDMTDEMLTLANKNKEKMGVENVEFLKGFIEQIPLANESLDVILSNCVINLSEDKEKALSEAYRVLKTGGRLAIADIVNLKDVPDHVRKSAEMWAGCIAGTLPMDVYKEILEKVGFHHIKIEPIHIYTKSVIEGLAKQQNMNMEDLLAISDIEILDGAFAGAYIKAYK